MFHFILYPNPALLSQKRFFSVLLRDLVMSKVLISTEIEGIYNESWKNRGVLPYDKNQLQNKILKGQFSLLEQVNLTAFKRSDIPEFVFDRIVRDTKLGCNSSCLAHESDGDWIHVYETNKPEDSLLLMAIVNIIFKTYVRRRLNIPKRLPLSQ